jgi:nucleotide-binding universal stress UspA family protein/FixJ family two-component response regulator
MEKQAVLKEEKVRGGEKMKPILIVEDEAIMRESLQDWLTDGGYQVETVDEGEKALKAIEEQDFGVVILDLRLPGKDGLEVLKEAREKRPKLKGIIITAYPSVQSAVESMKEGAIDYLAKPFNLNELEKVVRETLGSVQVKIKPKAVAKAEAPQKAKISAVYNRILVPLDGSPATEVALPYAEKLAGRLGSEVTLIYVGNWAKDQYQHMGRFYIQKMVETTKQGARRYAKKSEQQVIKVRSAILVGDPAEEIVRYVKQERIGLVLTAMGSVADKVLRVANRPMVLMGVRGAHPDVQGKSILSKVLVPLDGSRESEAVIPYIEELASNLRLDVVLLQVLAGSYYPISVRGYDHIRSSKEQMESDKALAKAYLDKVGARLKKKGVTVESEVRFGVAAEEIIKLTDEICADVVAMSTHHQNGAARWIYGSVAKKVLRRRDISLLMLGTLGQVAG